MTSALDDIAAIAFDLDGTLIDSAPDIQHALNAALGKAALTGVDDLAVVRGWIGDGPDALIERALTRLGADLDDAGLRARLRRGFDAATLAAPLSLGRVFPGVQALVEALHRRLPMVVVTNKPTQLARAVLDAAGLLSFFAALHGGDEPSLRKPAPGLLLQAARRLGLAPARLLMVGDSALDLRAAHAAGCPAALALWGHGGQALPDGLQPWRVATPEALLRALPTAPERAKRIIHDREMNMPTGGRPTLTKFLIEQRRRHPGATGDLNALVTGVSLACKAISRKVALGTLGDALGGTGIFNVQGEEQKPLDVVSNQMFLRAAEWDGQVAGMVSEEMEEVYRLPEQYARGKYLLLFDPLDGSSNIDVNVAVGSIFSVLRAATPGEDAKAEDFLKPGTQQVCAGYAIYGPSTMLVLTLGDGTHAFTLEPTLGEWVLSHPNLAIPEKTREFAINASNRRFWEPAVKRYVDECLAGQTGPRGIDFNMRWIASLVAETHRILMRGGVFMYPRDNKDPSRPGRLRLLYEANPIAMLVEQAGGRASTGWRRVMEVQPEALHQRIGFIFGSAEEVARIEDYHREEPLESYQSPLFGKRGLFATTMV